MAAEGGGLDVGACAAEDEEGGVEDDVEVWFCVCAAHLGVVCGGSW